MAMHAKLWIFRYMGGEVGGVFGVDTQPGPVPCPPLVERFRLDGDSDDLFPQGFEVGFVLERPSQPGGVALEEFFPVGEERHALLERFGVEPWHGRDLCGLKC